ncbi:hypothetical protein [Nannocystis pusilla]|uniref:hypothetical protein n=1 Tax=Nannocystis pusilla TaxID=889268 RepID=UPI003BEFE679
MLDEADGSEIASLVAKRDASGRSSRGESSGLLEAADVKGDASGLLEAADVKGESSGLLEAADVKGESSGLLEARRSR